MTTPTQNETPVQGTVSVTPPPPPPVTPPPALAAAPAVAEHVPAPAQLTEPGPATTYAEQLTVQQLLHSPQEVYMLWFNFIPGLNFIPYCFKIIIIHYNTPEQREIKF